MPMNLNLPAWMTPEQRYFAAQQAEQQAQSDARYNLGQQQSLFSQHNQNRDIGIQNINNAAQAQAYLASLGYNLGNDVQQQALRNAQMQTQLAEQQRADNRYTQGLNLDIAQLDQSNNRYVQGLQQDLARLAYQRSTSPIQSQAATAARILGY